ncbi:MAG: hypothetical protein ACRBCI_07175 [Cellvibrionaceae bacterium]
MNHLHFLLQHSPLRPVEILSLPGQAQQTFADAGIYFGSLRFDAVNISIE